jgi:hypothetical protein
VQSDARDQVTPAPCAASVTGEIEEAMREHADVASRDDVVTPHQLGALDVGERRTQALKPLVGHPLSGGFRLRRRREHKITDLGALQGVSTRIDDLELDAPLSVRRD